MVRGVLPSDESSRDPNSPSQISQIIITAGKTTLIYSKTRRDQNPGFSQLIY